MLQRARIFGPANIWTEVYRYDTSTEDAINELIILNSEMITTKRTKGQPLEEKRILTSRSINL